MLALSIATRHFKGLLAPLAYGQVAPVPFLWAERLMVIGFGVNEWALRALPVLAGCALCVAIILVGRRMLQPGEVLVALVLIAFSQVLVRYSVEIKSYSWDALLAVAVVGAAASLISRLDDWRSWAYLAGLGMVAALSSLSAPFICLAAGVSLTVCALTARRLDLLPRIGLLALLWATLFALPYRLLYQGAGSATYMHTYWASSFLLPGSADLTARTHAALVEMARAVDPGWTLFGLSVVPLGTMLLGTALLWRRKGAPYALLLVTPTIALFAASVAAAYPIATRLILFAAPLSIMLMAVGVMGTAQMVRHVIPAVPTRWGAGLLLLPAITTGVASVLIPRDQQLRPMVQELTRHWRGGDAVYVFHRVVPAWLFHSTDWTRPNLKQLAWAMRVSGPGGLGHENGPSRGPRPPGEGQDLVYELNGHSILLGTSSGVQGRPVLVHQPIQPDEGWAANEVQRMRAASPVVWLIIGNAISYGVDLGHILLNAAEQAAGRVTFQDSLQDGRLYRLDFHSTTQKPRQ
jgi:4-amino-4-deoxy-L-arabinose transferase-like glycosyltransferase